MVTWYYNGIIVPNSEIPNIGLLEQNSTLSFSPVLNSHEGLYVCAVDNGVGMDNVSIVLTVIS